MRKWDYFKGGFSTGRAKKTGNLSGWTDANYGWGFCHAVFIFLPDQLPANIFAARFLVSECDAGRGYGYVRHPY